MSENKKETQPGQSQALPIAMLAVAVFGVLLTITIELSHQYPWIMELCGGSSSGCADVASTPYSKVPFEIKGRQISVAYLGLLAYVFFIFFQVYGPRLAAPMAAAMMGAEIYFLWIMHSVLGIFCMFCVIQFVTVTILFLLTMAWEFRQSGHFLPGGMWSNILVVALAFIIPATPVMMKTSAQPVVDGDFVTYVGDPKSNIRVDIYSDYQCPYCKKIEPLVETIIQKNPDALLVFRDYIIPSHPLSPYAVSFTNGVAFTQGREAFVKLRREMFEHQEKLKDFLESRQEMVKFTPELRAKIEKKVEGDLKIAQSLDIYSTPTIVIYRGGKMAQIIKTPETYEKLAPFLKP